MEYIIIGLLIVLPIIGGYGVYEIIYRKPREIRWIILVVWAISFFTTLPLCYNDVDKNISGRAAFESGALLIALHHKTFGNYGSMAMREYVFENYFKRGEMPQSSQEMEKIVAEVNRIYSDPLTGGKVN